ncbi:hypothetical protein [Paracidovorax oryzae]|uniref:hypothetical protein n=1 Tax=Paracidovorax oryzae TaxID=862720 RepID=UPI0012EC7E8D|nr:hypothetical protein [Paracidovorax oryzae]
MLEGDDIKEAFAGFFIYDCAVRTSDCFSFAMLESIDDAASGDQRLLNFFANKPVGERVAWDTYEGFDLPVIAASRVPVNQTVMVSLTCDVAVLGGGRRGIEAPIPRGGSEGDVLRSCYKLAAIDGRVYAVGSRRTVCKRVDHGKWESLASDRSTLPRPSRVGLSSDGGFSAIDGFSESDIYCVGGKGDAWRYNGQRWYQCMVPTNMYFESVCCAGDGFVYIGMQSGSVMRGREDSWEIIHRDEMTLAFKDMVWYGDKVWCTSDYGLWVIEDGKLKEADVPPEVKACSGNLSVGDGVMLLAGMYGATVFDGRNWQRIL